MSVNKRDFEELREDISEIATKQQSQFEMLKNIQEEIIQLLKDQNILSPQQNETRVTDHGKLNYNDYLQIEKEKSDSGEIDRNLLNEKWLNFPVSNQTNGPESMKEDGSTSVFFDKDQFINQTVRNLVSKVNLNKIMAMTDR